MYVKSQLKDAQFENILEADLSTTVPRMGRVVFTTDSKNTYVGDGTVWVNIRKPTYITVGTAADLLAGRCDYGTFADAITAAGAGGKIVVLPGTYNETVNIGVQVHIEGSGRGTKFEGTINLQSDNISINNLYIDGTVTTQATTYGCMITNCWLHPFTLIQDLNNEAESMLVLAVREKTP